jgi:hypothetical protein
MGFWAGMNEGLTYVLDKKAAKETEDRAYAFKEKEYQRTLADGRIDKLIELKAARVERDREASVVTGDAQALYSKFGEEDLSDPRAQALLNNPALAAQLYEKVAAIEAERAKAGINAPPLQGQNLLDIFTVYDAETDTVAPADLTIDEIMERDVSDPAVYEQAVLDLTGTQGGGAYVTINPSAYYVPDPKKLEEGRTAFNELVLQEAQRELKGLSGDDNSAAASDLQGQIDNYKTENSVERLELQDKYGYSVYKKLRATDNPYIQDFKNDPQLGRFHFMYAEEQARAILADPEASQADLDGASAWLRSQGLN